MASDVKVANAVVTITPSMEGARKSISSDLTEVLGASGDSAGRGFGSKFSSGFSAATVAIGNIVADVVESAARKAGQLISDTVGGAFESFARYEQLEGGVDKIFGDSADAVIANAREAYVTAGLDMNAYLETVTGFSSSLIQSLGGDTQTAAAMADMAIRDMSDNVNTFGSDFDSVMRAYQGFARGTFGMLDNLKLGYGGSRSEAERLLKTAEELQAAQGVYVEYSLDSYADIVEAINVVQQSMEITGKTALEAATTIEGAKATMDAAWQNLLVSFGDPDIDTAEMVDKFVKSFSNYAQLALPRLVTILAEMAAQLPEVIGGIAGEIPDIIASALDTAMGEGAGAQFLESFAPIFDSFGKAIDTVVPEIVDLAATTIPMLVDAAAAILPVITSVLDATGPLVPVLLGVGGAIAPIITSVISLAGGLPALGAAFSALGGPMGIVIGLAASAVAGLIGLWTTNEEFRGGIIGIWEGIKTTFWNAIVAIDGFIGGLGESIGQKFDAVWEKVTGVGEAIVDFWSSIPERILGFFSNIGSGISRLFEAIKLPRFILHGSINPLDWPSQGLPGISVEWFADGGYITEPTTVAVAGETGGEWIVPDSPAKIQPFGDAIVDAMDVNLNEVVELLREIRDTKTQIVMDSGELVGATINATDTGLGSRENWASRGVAYA